MRPNHHTGLSHAALGPGSAERSVTLGLALRSPRLPHPSGAVSDTREEQRGKQPEPASSSPEPDPRSRALRNRAGATAQGMSRRCRGDSGGVGGGMPAAS
ncbi:hypothetical protein GCM10011579_097360 [Streptomyces albiflavescens]|uniref:Uncharacterized protein n=1 Tax=Streptomyces albiflavescens TaxID=1623582 RepID=A0A917YG03_9ACTN|nr:hypothetical protein GCM10011579_097360 [Streptomyces albiflavescens]